ncbi:Serine/threonine-protein kinase HT1 [Tritrichomonas foetus]|uniref:Serine/threonine-protein kinase HT1 n=1 Tax=Tritrichomonas foetus TaxID=1144522 RepID=A0A1J4KSE1_9EUKA|nr:Serine/threonine-protein kinase HT1 [Tritrichomonas foetus]|eukprot:OHT12582.1 Serine/threonine-protein kinase HT1 [Tritrichomonas foetus]
MGDHELYSLASHLGGGKILDAREFRMEKILGKGGFGNVYQAIHIPTGTLVAAKELFIEEMDEENLESFTREIDILGRCRHPFLLHLIGFTVQKPYTIFTPYIPHGSLYNHIHHSAIEPKLPPTNLSIIAMGIAYAMMHLHEMGVIHRDLKSPNVLLDNKYLPYVCDFGIARHVAKKNDELTRDCGTTGWMAPEQMKSHKYDNKVDVYSYGMILYEMISGYYPFEGKSTLDIAIALKNGKRPKLPDGNESIKNLIKQCWDQNPKKRPPFKDIYQLFLDQKVMFDDTNPKGIRAMASLTRKEEEFLAQLARESKK